MLIVVGDPAAVAGAGNLGRSGLARAARLVHTFSNTDIGPDDVCGEAYVVVKSLHFMHFVTSKIAFNPT